MPKSEKSKFNINLFIIQKFKLLVIAMIIVLSLVSWFFFIKSNRERVRGIKIQELNVLEKEVAAKRLKMQKLEARTRDIMILKNLRLESLWEMLGKEGSEEDLYIILEQIIQEQGLETSSLSLGRPRSLSGYGSIDSVLGENYKSVELPIVVIPVSLEIVDPGGNLVGYQKIKGILSALRNKSRIFNLGTLALGSKVIQDNSATGSQTGSFKLSFDVFMLAKPEDAAE